MSAPPEMTIGPAQTATVFDGISYIVLTADWRGGLWRFVSKPVSTGLADTGERTLCEISGTRPSG